MVKKGATAATAAAASAAATTAQPETLEDVIQVLKMLSAQFSVFSNKMDMVENLSSKLDTMEASLKSSLADNKKLQEELVEKTKAVGDLQASYAALEHKLNDLEQYNRQWSVRVHNIPLTSDEERNPIAIRNKVYELALRPILQGAVEAGELDSLPDAKETLELAHTLPGKPGQAKPVITRFKDRVVRSICLRLKKSYAPRTAEQGRGSAARTSGPATNTGGVVRDERGRYIFPFHEDLTRLNYSKMKAISADSRVLSCWSVNGQLRYRLTNSQEIKKVTSVFNSVEAILA
jgi:prefoldin subunit 5